MLNLRQGENDIFATPARYSSDVPLDGISCLSFVSIALVCIVACFLAAVVARYPMPSLWMPHRYDQLEGSALTTQKALGSFYFAQLFT